MSAGVEVFTVSEDADPRQRGEDDDKTPEEPLVEAMKSLREQLDRLESSYDAKQNSTTRSTPRNTTNARGVQESRSTLFRSGSPVRYEPSVITEDPSMRSDRPFTRTPPRPASSPRPVQFMSGTSDKNNGPEYHSLSATKLRSGTTPSRSDQTPFTPPLGTTPGLAPFSEQKATNQSFVSYLEPEPVQTPNPSVSGGTRGLSQAPELRLLDSLLGTVEAMKKRMDEQEARLELVERSNMGLQEEVRYWRSEASRWQDESQREREQRDEERQREAFHRRRDDAAADLSVDEDRYRRRRDESRRSWQRDDGRRDSSRDDRRSREWQRDDEHRRSASRRRSTELDDTFSLRSADRRARRSSATSPGGLFVEELSEKLPLDSDQHEVLVSLMNRYFDEEVIAGRRGR